MNNLVGRLCVKLAGSESGRHCIIVDIIDDNSVIIDGNVKRRKCNYSFFSWGSIDSKYFRKHRREN